MAKPNVSCVRYCWDAALRRPMLSSRALTDILGGKPREVQRVLPRAPQERRSVDGEESAKTGEEEAKGARGEARSLLPSPPTSEVGWGECQESNRASCAARDGGKKGNAGKWVRRRPFLSVCALPSPFTSCCCLSPRHCSGQRRKEKLTLGGCGGGRGQLGWARVQGKEKIGGRCWRWGFRLRGRRSVPAGIPQNPTSVKWNPTKPGSCYSVLHACLQK
jgi:hypothetical protein